MAASALVMDLGGGTLKLGIAGKPKNTLPPQCMVNSVIKAKHVKTRVFAANQIEDCQDLSSLYFMMPFQKGYLNNLDVQKQVWDVAFHNYNLSDHHLIMSEPLFNFRPIRESLNEIFFEEYGVRALTRLPAVWLAYYDYLVSRGFSNVEQCSAMVVDSGYSFTHLVPVHRGKLWLEHAKRINIGGKLLTNHLKEIISYRQLNVLEEFHVMDQCKEDACFVSTDYEGDLDRAAANTRGVNCLYARDYVLPDYAHIRRGKLRSAIESTGRPSSDGEQLVRMNQERFTVPELLFRPTDIGIDEAGISETLCRLLTEDLPTPSRPTFAQNILLVGGNAKFDGFAERVAIDVRRDLPADMQTKVVCPMEPQLAAWRGGQALAWHGGKQLAALTVTREEYEESGHYLCSERFNVAVG